MEKKRKKSKTNKLNKMYNKKKIPKKVKEEVWYTNFGKIRIHIIINKIFFIKNINLLIFDLQL